MSKEGKFRFTTVPLKPLCEQLNLKELDITMLSYSLNYEKLHGFTKNVSFDKREEKIYHFLKQIFPILNIPLEILNIPLEILNIPYEILNIP